MHVLTIGMIFCVNTLCTAFVYVNFDQSMRLAQYPLSVEQESNIKMYQHCKSIYEKLASEKLSHDFVARIPKIIHQIWLGGSVPECYQRFMQSWQRMHPDWQYIVWTDADVESFNLINQELFDAADNYGEKSDIWRYEILYRHGGLYVDIDFECLKSLEQLHYLFDFYIGIQPLDTSRLQLGIGIVGSVEQHPLLRAAIELLPLQQHYKQIVVRTGPIFFTKLFYCYAHNYAHTIALPASYFYPCGYWQKGQPSNYWLQPESYAVHHWAGSWLKKE